MSKNIPNLGEPYQIYSEVTNAGKNVQGSKKKIRWLIGFSERDGEIEVALIHSVVSGKKTVFEDGREITSSTNMLATDFGHTWRSETCPGRLFRVEFTQSISTDPTVYTFMVDGIKFTDMPKRGSIGGGGNRPISGFKPTEYASHSSSHTASSSRAVNGFGGHRDSGFGATTTAPKTDFGVIDGPAPHTRRRFIYGDEDEDDAPSKPAATSNAPSRANFQSPFSGGSNNANANKNADFGFDPFDESPAPAPAAKPSTTTDLFNAFDESPSVNKATTKSFDPFGASDPFASSADPFSTPAPAPAAPRPSTTTAPVTKATPPQAAKAPSAAMPNFFDDDFAAPAPAPVAASSTFDAFGSAPTTTPARRSSAIEISADFAGLSFAPPAPPAQTQPTAAAQLFAEPEPEEVAAPEPASKDPWAMGNDLVNLNLSGAPPVKRASVTDKGPSLASMMTSPGSGMNIGMGGGSRTGSMVASSPDVFGVPSNSRASFTSGSPVPMGGNMGGMGAPMGGVPMGGMGAGMNPRASFTAGPNAMGGAQMGGNMGGMGSMPMGGMGAPRASFTAGPNAMGGNMGGMPPVGGMASNHSSVSMGQPGAMGFGAPGAGPQGGMQSKRSSLDDLNWNM